VAMFFSNIKPVRAVATGSDKREDTSLASVQLASLRIWLRTYRSLTWISNRLRPVRPAGAPPPMCRRHTAGVIPPEVFTKRRKRRPFILARTLPPEASPHAIA